MKRSLITLAAVAMLAAACSPGDGADGGGSTGVQLSVQVASYEVVAGVPERFLVGLFTSDGVVSYGTADLTFSYMGDGSGSPEAGPSASATFLLVPQEAPGHTHPGEEPAASPSGDGMSGQEPPASPSADDTGGMGTDEHQDEAPSLVSDAELADAEQKASAITQPDQIRGVYQAKSVTFDRAGVWQVRVGVELNGATSEAEAAFNVVKEPAYPAPGQAAPASDNLVMNGKDAKPSMVDSRATDGWGSVPDPELHSGTVADSIRAGRPAVVVVSTPLYCQSRFCGPITDEVQALAADYADRANFIHLEVWRNYQGKVVNKAAAEWVYRDDVTEPWVFLVGADGKILERWQNVLDPRELRAALEQLPAA